MTYECQVCESGELTLFPEFNELPRITSDCRPFQPGGELALCAGCGAIQKLPTPQWLAEIDEIYRNYFAYYQADGQEQVVFDTRRREVRYRSDILLERLLDHPFLSPAGSALDIGCGTGVTLRSLSKALPEYALYGQDLDARCLPDLRAISQFRELFNCPVTEIPGQFDFITMIHSLEHFPAPLEVLTALRSKLNDRGSLLIQVCDTDQNPFDMLIADHLMHFSAATLSRIARRAGYSVRSLANDWIGKELSLVAVDGTENTGSSNTTDVASQAVGIRVRLRWLSQLLESGEDLAKKTGAIGVFGTSIAGTWLASVLGERVEFFVDEDPNRVGKTHMGKPVLSPAQVEAKRVVYVALIPAIARTIAERLSGFAFHVVEPPPLG